MYYVIYDYEKLQEVDSIGRLPLRSKKILSKDLELTINSLKYFLQYKVYPQDEPRRFGIRLLRNDRFVNSVSENDIKELIKSLERDLKILNILISAEELEKTAEEVAG